MLRTGQVNLVPWYCSTAPVQQCNSRINAEQPQRGVVFSMGPQSFSDSTLEGPRRFSSMNAPSTDDAQTPTRRSHSKTPVFSPRMGQAIPTLRTRHQGPKRSFPVVHPSPGFLHIPHCQKGRATPSWSPRGWNFCFPLGTVKHFHFPTN